MPKLAVYAGSFDPITRGHLSVVRRAVEIFGECIVLVAVNQDKKCLFTVEERMSLIDDSAKEWAIPYVFPRSTTGFVADWCDYHSHVLVRGIRDEREMRYETTIADFNRNRRNIETVFIPAFPELAMVSSTGVKLMAEVGGPLDKFVMPCVARALTAKR